MIRTCPYCGNELDSRLKDIEEDEERGTEYFYVVFSCFRCSYSVEETLVKVAA